jgi:thioredoxin
MSFTQTLYLNALQKLTAIRGVLVLNDEELEEIRRRKMQILMERAQKAKQPQVMEPMANGRVNLLTDANFWQTIQQTKFALVDFFGEWCNPCKALAPIFAELARDYKEKVYFAKIDIDRNRQTTTQFDVHSVPMVIAFKNGKPLGKIPGLRSYNDYDMVLEQLIAKGPDESSYV